ncbi:MAG TPA: septation protein SepH [Microlunatus sp.]|nr:septation protein SepH [Microlunatus sp.]
MRGARMVGLSPDGRFVIVATETGEELAIAADDRLRAALRGGPAASKKLEIEMESALSPREIQTRIRSGESVEDVARVAGVDRERVERFAAPVIAEREHVAGLAMTSSARRRGETSSHRTLRGVLNERLLDRGVDIDSVVWDSYRLDDGRWSVTADYRTGETPRQAVFSFDVAGRYSVAGNDEGRWVLGDTSPGHGPQPGPPPEPGEHGEDTEPTIDLSDELALVRAIQDVPPTPRAADGAPTAVEVTEAELSIAEVVQFHRVARVTAEQPPIEETVEEQPAVEEPRDETGDDENPADHDGTADEQPESGLDTLYDMFSDQDPQDEPRFELVVETMDEETVLEVAAPNGSVADAVPSDASAVPELGPSLRSDAWEPAIVVDYPVEPSEDRSDGDVEVPEGSDDPGRPEPAVAADDRRDEAASLVDTVLFGDSPTEAVTEPEEQLLPLDVPEQPAPATPPKAPRRKRASVPSWDEIVFGGPKEK